MLNNRRMRRVKHSHPAFVELEDKPLSRVDSYAVAAISLLVAFYSYMRAKLR